MCALEQKAGTVELYIKHALKVPAMQELGCPRRRQLAARCWERRDNAVALGERDPVRHSEGQRRAAVHH